MSSSTRPFALSLILKRSPCSVSFDNREIMWSGMVSNKMFDIASAVTLGGWDRLAAIVWGNLQDSPEDKGRHHSWGIEAGNSQSKQVIARNKGNKHVHKHPKIRLHAMQCRSWLTCMCAHVRMCNRQLSATDNWCESSMDRCRQERSRTPFMCSTSWYERQNDAMPESTSRTMPLGQVRAFDLVLV